jgi:hypothetical protein
MKDGDVGTVIMTTIPTGVQSADCATISFNGPSHAVRPPNWLGGRVERDAVDRNQFDVLKNNNARHNIFPTNRGLERGTFKPARSVASPRLPIVCVTPFQREIQRHFLVGV